MAREAVAFALAALMVLAGCIGAQDGDEQLDQASVDAGTVNEQAQRVVAHVGDQAVAVPEDARELLARVADTGFNGAEPTLGVLSDGTIVTNPFTDDESLAISEDHGQSWEIIGDQVANPKTNLDPWMWVDPDTDRIYNGPLYVVCSWLSWSDDRGQSWDFNPAAGCSIPAHDHQKITTGPPAPGVDTTGYPNVVYYSYNSFRGEGTWVTTSLDGGRTFGLGNVAHPADACRGGIAGPVHVGPDGTAYSAKATCEGTRVAVSHNSGASWTVGDHLRGQGMYNGLAINPDVDTDTEGTAYLATPGGDGRLYTSVGTQKGEVWSELIQVSPPGVTFTQFSVVSAGEPGQVAFAYLGTTDDVSTWDRPEPSYARDEAVWHLYITTQDALAEEPVFTTVQVTPEDDPVQRGCIWLWGGGNECRNLLDFIDMVEHEGRAYVAFTDGCDACETAEDSRERLHKVAILERGPGLAGELLEPLVELAGTG